MIPLVDVKAQYAPFIPELKERFAEVLQERGIAATLRISKGQDIAAGCGQLKVPEGRAKVAR